MRTPSATMAPFISIENMKLVIDSLNQIIRESDDRILRAAESGHAPIRQVVYDVMADMAQDPAYDGLSLRELNHLAVETASQFYEQLASEMHAMQESQQIAPEPRRRQTFEPEPSAPFNVANATESSLPGVVNPPLGDNTSPSIIQCISIDGHERDLQAHPSRYAFTYTLDTPLRQVTSAAAPNVVVPVVDQTINCQFLLLVIDQLPGSYSHNASGAVRTALAKLVPKSQWSSHDGRSYTVLEPVANDTRVFDPPIASLSRLTVHLLRPDGQDLSDARDDAKVVNIAPGGPDDVPTYTMTLEKAKPRQEFLPMDIVVITGIRTGNHAFDTYMNRVEGHVIVKAGAPNPMEGTQTFDGVVTIVIKRAGNMDPATGQEQGIPGANDVFRDTGSLDLAESPASILNMSVQVSITLETACEQAGVSSTS